jgi:hypothetical protein
LLLGLELGLVEIPQKTEILDDARIADFHLVDDLCLEGHHFRFIRNTGGKVLKLSPQFSQDFEGLCEFLVDFGGVASHYLGRSVDVDEFPHAVGAQHGVLLAGRAEDAGDVAAAIFAELEGDADGAGGDTEGWDHIIGGELAEFYLESVLVQIVDDHGLEVEFLLDEVYLKVVNFVAPFENPLDVVDVHPQLFPDAIDAQLLELHLRPAEALQAAVGLQQVGFEFIIEIDHIRA